MTYRGDPGSINLTAGGAGHLRSVTQAASHARVTDGPGLRGASCWSNSEDSITKSAGQMEGHLCNFTEGRKKKTNKTENNLKARACCPVSGLCGFERGEVETGFLR